MVSKFDFINLRISNSRIALSSFLVIISFSFYSFLLVILFSALDIHGSSIFSIVGFGIFTLMFIYLGALPSIMFLQCYLFDRKTLLRINKTTKDVKLYCQKRIIIAFNANEIIECIEYGHPRFPISYTVIRLSNGIEIIITCLIPLQTLYRLNKGIKREVKDVYLFNRLKHKNTVVSHKKPEISIES